MYALLHRIQQLDIQLQYYLNQQWRNPVFDAVLPLFSSVFLFCMVAFLGLLFIAWRYGWAAFISTLKIGVILSIVTLVTYSSCGLIKDKVGRLRPYQAIAGSYYQESGQWVRNPPKFVPTRTKGDSFPSRHAAGSAALCLGFLLMLGKRLRRWQKGVLISLPFLVGWSRLYLGKHYVFDVLGGLLLGCLIVSVLWVFFWRSRNSRFLFNEPSSF